MDNLIPKYEPPVIVTYTNEEILEELGPARTVTSGGVVGNNLLGG